MYTCSSTFNCRETCPNGTKFIKNYILIPWSSDWDLVEEKSCPKLTKAQTEKTLSDNKGDFAWRLHLVFNHLKLLLESFSAHQFCTSWQHQQMKNLLETCPEIYSCQHQDQLQANLKEPPPDTSLRMWASRSVCFFTLSVPIRTAPRGISKRSGVMTFHSIQ